MLKKIKTKPITRRIYREHLRIIKYCQIKLNSKNLITIHKLIFLKIPILNKEDQIMYRGIHSVR